MSNTVKITNRLRQGIPLMLKKGDTNEQKTLAPKASLVVDKDVLTEQTHRLAAQKRITIS